MNDVSFRTLLYRYFFFGWLFQDVSSAGDNQFARAAAMRHNRRQADWLPLYMLRWLCCAALLYGFGRFLELDTPGAVTARLAYLASVMCISFTSTIAIAWVALRREML